MNSRAFTFHQIFTFLRPTFLRRPASKSSVLTPHSPRSLSLHPSISERKAGMGIWDYLCSTADSVGLYTVTPVKSLCSAAVTNAGKVHSLLPYEDALSVMYKFATNCTKNAAIFACRQRLKSFPAGGSIYEILLRSYNEAKKSKPTAEEVKALRAELNYLKEMIEKMQVGHEEQMKEMQSRMSRMEEELSRLRISSSQLDSEMIQELNEDGSEEDELVKMLMGNGFMGGLFLDGLHSDVKQPPLGIVFRRIHVVNGFMLEKKKLEQG